MFIRITQLLQKNRRVKILFLCICFSFLSLYPIFRNFYYGNGILTYERHIAFLEKRSDFFNPWQYRVLCPMLVEGTIWVYDHTIDKLFPIENHLRLNVKSTTGTTDITDQLLDLSRNPDAVRYMVVFIFIRFVEDLAIFWLAYLLWSYFIRNDWLIFFGMLYLDLSLGNAVAVADLTLNTYMDNILYLVAACLIVYRRNPWWFIVLILLGALNRETSIMIPFLYFISCTDFSGMEGKWWRWSRIRLPAPRIWAMVAFQYILFFTVFLAIRHYYGFRPQQMWKVPSGLPMLRLNLLSLIGMKSYFEMIGTFGVIPLIILYTFRRYPLLLKVWFLGIVPVWFLAHLLTVVTYQTRLFLVPLILIFLPMMMWLIEQQGNKSADGNPLARAA